MELASELVDLTVEKRLCKKLSMISTYIFTKLNDKLILQYLALIQNTYTVYIHTILKEHQMLFIRNIVLVL